MPQPLQDEKKKKVKLDRARDKARRRPIRRELRRNRGPDRMPAQLRRPWNVAPASCRVSPPSALESTSSRPRKQCNLIGSPPGIDALHAERAGKDHVWTPRSSRGEEEGGEEDGLLFASSSNPLPHSCPCRRCCYYWNLGWPEMRKTRCFNLPTPLLGCQANQR